MNYDATEILDILIRSFIVPAIPLLTMYMIYFLKKGINYLKDKSEKEQIDHYLGLVGEMLEKSVLYTSQTYVSSLKQQQGKLTPEQVKEANRKAIEAFEKSIGEDGKLVIENLYGDYQDWIEKSIESIVAKQHI